MKLKILLLCDYNLSNASMVIDHINSLYRYSENEVYVLSDIIKNNGNIPNNIKLIDSNDSKKIDNVLDLFDCVVIHYSLTLALETYISHKLKQKLRDFEGLKVLFIQDEYRFLDKTIENINFAGIDLIFSCIPTKEIPKIYKKSELPNVKIVNVLTGYTSEYLSYFPIKPFKKRKYDVSYRGRKYPLWHGRLGFEKWNIAKQFIIDAKKYKLKTNISVEENRRYYGYSWIEFLQNTKAVLGVESGASVFDYSGEISAKVEIYENLLKNSKKKTLSEEKAELDEYRKKFFKDIEDRYEFSQISPRIFEAISLKTVLILYEGNYSGILKAWKHYIPLKKDHSNMNEVVDVLKDDKKCAEMVSNAYIDIVLSEKYSYKKFVQSFDREIEKEYLNKAPKRKYADDLISQELFMKTNKVFLFNNPYIFSVPVANNIIKYLKGSLLLTFFRKIKKRIK